MRILLGSHHFFPSTGGIETASNLLAREFVALGHEVRVVTQTAGDGDFPFAVIRRPGLFELLRHVRWCDVLLQNNISLRTLWPLLFVRRPLFVTHQTWITDSEGGVGWQHRLKRFVLRFATSLAISRAVGDRLPAPSIQVGNPYDDKVFKEVPPEPRTKELIFVGRLVSDKGVSVLLEAMALLEAKPRLTIAGDGPERDSLEKQTIDLQLESRVDFIGTQTSEQLAKLLRQHQILVVPSRWREPFGIVALEGIASGCVVVGSAGGGLAEAIGPCGLTFPNGDAHALAHALSRLLEDPAEQNRLRQNAPAHLARFTPRHVAGLYLDAMKSASR
ncbi:MAG TPA: glycosyltransferase family 4 protein [Chthoniobacterales bacterium]|nr:glycosyltransferase family 4 protein [Chthoniobacterales bacterium]